MIACPSQDAGIREDPGSAVCRETFFQRFVYITCNILDQGILPVLKNRNLIPEFLSFVQMVVPVRNEPVPGMFFPVLFPVFLPRSPLSSFRA